jgi:nitrate/TMAO reductase-like tetraheme cytochrome c subunit
MKALYSILVVLALLPGTVLAEDDEGGKYGGEDRGKVLQPARLNPAWQKECGSCHIPYAPGLLPAESWRKLMAGLDKHFGTDASLSAEENRDISTFLAANASNRWTGSAAPLRISETQWFKSKHGTNEIAAAVWKRASVKSPANCQACHPAADKANFSEHSINIPK